MRYTNGESLTKPRQATSSLVKTHRIIKTLCYGWNTDGHSLPIAFACETYRPLQLVRTGVMDPVKTKSKGGTRYVLFFVDDYSRYVVTYFLKKKKNEIAKSSRRT
ncbi:LOW QUALITY PROTEIN: polyprotein [Phytophthora megakarya]|uniref:Polyprotein n=1 Tax=Phytophthora megakarya TaxID=4795 RepID=A0A225WAS9_9STRA|nr:LOW QUALITY PROTEIN: polyprotein [Phytophthora megakarya]